MSQKMKTNHSAKEEIHILDNLWRRLHVWQKIGIVVPVLLGRLVTACADWLPQTVKMINGLQDTRLLYLVYPAHWIRR